jgi:hypothetical protein
MISGVKKAGPLTPAGRTYTGRVRPFLLEKIAVLAIFSDISFVAGGKKRGFCRLLWRVATPERRFFRTLALLPAAKSVA